MDALYDNALAAATMLKPVLEANLEIEGRK
jgi:hypothetical protein